MNMDDLSIMLYAQDLPKSLRFYREFLGFDFQGWWSEEKQARLTDWAAAGRPGYAELSAGRLSLSLHHSDGPVATGGVLFHVKVDDVDAFRRRVERNGGEISEPKTEPWGWRTSYIDDPDGHQWAFYTPDVDGGDSDP